MKTSSLHKSFSILVCLGMLAALGGCGKKPSSSDVSLTPTGRSVPVSVQTNSFKQVAAHLDPGGAFYLYLGTEQWFEGLSAKMADVRQLLTSLPNTSTQDRANIGRLFDVLANLVKSSGVEEVSALGASGVEIEKGFYRNKSILHHYPGRNQGLIWTMFGKEPHELTGLDYLPQNTALASYGDLDVALLWTTIKDQIQQAGIPELSQGIQQVTKGIEKQVGVSLDKLLESLGGEVGFVLVLDPSRIMPLPRGNGPKIDVPELAMALMLKVKDDLIFNKIDSLMQQNPQLSKQLIKTDKDGVKMRSMPLPLPFPLRPSVARAGDFLFLSSTDTLINEMLAVKDGKKGLKGLDEFKKKSKGIPLEGNSFAYMSPEIGRTINHIIGSIADWQSANGQADRGADILEKLIGDKESFSFAVASNTKEGWFVQANSSQHPALAFLGPTVMVPMAIAGATAMPRMAQAKAQAQSVACVNNMKQIGLAARLYANDHADVLPKNFDEMKDELATPKILICPGAPKQAKAASWNEFNFADASYEIVAPGISATNDPQTVYARCSIHGTVCCVDGSVQRNQPTPRSRGPRRTR